MASCMIARALNCDGLNCWAKLSYSAIGMLHSSRIHSASRQIVPSDLVYSPSRNEYAPKWMNMPNRSLRHQDVRAEVNGSSTAELVPGPAISASGPSSATSIVLRRKQTVALVHLQIMEPQLPFLAAGWADVTQGCRGTFHCGRSNLVDCPSSAGCSGSHRCSPSRRGAT